MNLVVNYAESIIPSPTANEITDKTLILVFIFILLQVFVVIRVISSSQAQIL